MGKKKYRILSIDGGGLRGVLSVRMLKTIESQHPGFLDQVDMFAGNSAGSIIAAGLATGSTLDNLESLFVERGPGIFKVRFLAWIPFFWAKYGHKRKEQEFADLYQESTMKSVRESNGKNLFIATFLLDSDQDPEEEKDERRSWKAKFYHNLPNLDESSTFESLSVTELVMKSTAPPTYFAIRDHHVDGALVANNPSLCAYSEVRNWLKSEARKSSPQDEHPEIDTEVVVLRIGSGEPSQYITSKSGDWGYFNWGTKLLHIIFSSASGLAHYQCKELLEDRYHSVNKTIPNGIGLDDLSAISKLTFEASELDKEKLDAFMERHWFDDELTKGKSGE